MNYKTVILPSDSTPNGSNSSEVTDKSSSKLSLPIISSCSVFAISRSSVKCDMYNAAKRIVSVFEGFFSFGKRGMRSRKRSIPSFMTWTRFLSRVLAILLCLLKPVRRRPRLFVFFFEIVALGVSSSGTSLSMMLSSRI